METILQKVYELGYFRFPLKRCFVKLTINSSEQARKHFQSQYFQINILRESGKLLKSIQSEVTTGGAL